jgi:hypothetical protein
MFRNFFGAVVLALLLGMAPAAATVIALDFEDGGPAGHGPVPVHNYSIDGYLIQISDATYIISPHAPCCGLGKVMIDPFVTAFGPGPGPFRPIVVDFDFAATSVSVSFSSPISIIENSLTAYGASGELIDSEIVTGLVG